LPKKHNSNSRSDSGRLFFAAVSLLPDGFTCNLRIKETLNKTRLTAFHEICVQIFT